jgi:hypothetical protein
MSYCPDDWTTIETSFLLQLYNEEVWYTVFERHLEYLVLNNGTQLIKSFSILKIFETRCDPQFQNRYAHRNKLFVQMNHPIDTAEQFRSSCFLSLDLDHRQASLIDSI